MDNRRFFLFVALAFAILIANQQIVLWLFPPPPQPKPVAKQDKAAGKPGAGERQDRPGLEKPADEKQPPAPAAERPAGQPAKVEAVAPRWWTLGSADAASGFRLLVTLTNQGAAVETIEMNEDRYGDVDDRSGYLGYLAAGDAAGKGALVQSVGPGTPAARAGLKPGDVIASLGGSSITSAASLRDALERTKPGQSVELSVLRDGAAAKLTAALARRPVQLVRPEFNTQPLISAAIKQRDPLSLLLTLEQIGDQKLADTGEELAGLKLRSAAWQLDEGRSSDRAATFWTIVPERNLKIVKRYELARAQPGERGFDEPAYHLSLRVEIENLGNKPVELAYRLDGPTGVVLEGRWYGSRVGRNWSGGGLREIVFRATEQETEYSTLTIADGTDLKEIEPWPDADVAWLATDAQYFTVATIPQHRSADARWLATVQPIRAGAVPTEPRDKRFTNVSYRMVSKPLTLAAGAKSPPHDYLLFAGPKRPRLLAQYRAPRPAEDRVPSLEAVTYYGWPIFAGVARILLVVLHFFHGLVGNYGLSIFLLTVLVRACVHPLTRKQTLSAHKMQELMPEIKRLKEKHKKDAQALIKAQQELFRKHHYNQFAGCMPALVQLPIFIGLYRSLMVDVELRQAPLLSLDWRWCSNLAAPDMLADWSRWMPSLFTSGFFNLGPYFNVLPIITIALFLWQQKMFLPPPTDEQAEMQQKMMKYMMIFMGFMFYKVASGLCLYFIASTTWSILERKVLLPKPRAAAQADLALAGSASPPATGNGTSGEPSSRRRQRRR